MLETSQPRRFLFPSLLSGVYVRSTYFCVKEISIAYPCSVPSIELTPCPHPPLGNLKCLVPFVLILAKAQIVLPYTQMYSYIHGNTVARERGVMSSSL